ncbi:MAG: hypothetical protein KA064_01325 [Firmicutes bacterium]|nr:hypothetical protein [Bacillota bacterium]
MSLVVGVPRALLFHEYGPLMLELLRQCGARAVLSPVTNKQILEAGLETCVDEACLPVKAFFGHAVYLAQQVDALFVPRFVSVERGAYICPKLMGLPDTIRARAPGAPRIIDPCIDMSRGLGKTARSIAELAPALGVSGSRLAIALMRSMKAASTNPDRRFDDGRTAAAGSGVRIGVLGHDYNLNDPYISLDLVSKIRRLGAAPVTAGAYSHKETARWERQRTRSGAKRLFWTFGRRLLGAAYRWLDTGEVDGIVHLASFGCGPESFIAEVIQHEASERDSVPLMCVNIDEHSAEAGLSTRLEAFIDTVAMRKCEHANHLPTPWQPVDTR